MLGDFHSSEGVADCNVVNVLVSADASEPMLGAGEPMRRSVIVRSAKCALIAEAVCQSPQQVQCFCLHIAQYQSPICCIL